MNQTNEEKWKFIDIFAGIGEFHLALHDLGAERVFAPQINPYAISRIYSPSTELT